MKTAGRYLLSEEQKKALSKGRLLGYLTLLYILSDIVFLYLVMGNSQAMLSAFLEDIAALMPALAFIISSHICWKKPTKRFPYGYHRVSSIGFLVAALFLLGMGCYIFADSIVKLIQLEHPTIGLKKVFGHDIWQGWLMIAEAPWGAIPPFILGRMKLKLAPKINDKVLYTDAKMLKADWLTSLSTVTGVLGIGIGWWGADALAAIFISLDILKDGFRETKDAVTSLMDRWPKSVEGEYLPLPDKVENRLRQFTWIKDVKVRLHEQGHLIFGEGFFLPHEGAQVDPKEVQKAIKTVQDMDWRIFGFALSVAENPQDYDR